MPKVFAVIPAFNEEKRIGKTLNSLKNFDFYQIIVVDDGSTDKTSETAKNYGAFVIRNEKNSGKGRAVKKALEYLSSSKLISDEDIVLFIDADTEDSAAEAFNLVKKLKEIGLGYYTVAVFPPPKKKGGFGFVKNLAKNFIRKQFGVELRAPISGQRAVFYKDLKKAIKAFNYGYGLEVAFNYIMLKNGIKPIEVPLNMSHRETGRNLSDFIHRGRQFLSILKVIIHARLGWI